MTRFRQDNTMGYDAFDLMRLNAAYETIMADNAPDCERRDDIAEKSHADHVAEELLYRYDSGLRGADLIW